MCNYEWIGPAREHFKNCRGKAYKDGDDTSEKSKEINLKLRELIQAKLQDNDQVVLNLRGSKWCVQGQRRLNHGIWYRAHHKDFGPNYPVVFGVYLGSDGLNIAIQIYNTLLPDRSLLEMLGAFISEAVTGKGLEKRKRKNFDTDEPYYDFGYFNVAAKDIDNKFNKVLGVYQGLPKQISTALEVYQDLPGQISTAMFGRMIELYKTAPSSEHCKINTDDPRYKLLTAVNNQVNTFIKATDKSDEDLETMFRSFWRKKNNDGNNDDNNDDIISSAQQAACATNVIRNNGGIVPLKENIERLVGLRDQEGRDLLQEIQGCIENSKNSALELYYLYHMGEDNFPLINGCSRKALKIIKKNKI